MALAVGSLDMAAPAGAPATAAGPASRGLVLLVDDEPSIARGYARILTAAGFTVDTAVDGGEAAELARGKSFDVIVSDIAMPGMDGLALLHTVREHDLDVPVVL